MWFRVKMAVFQAHNEPNLNEQIHEELLVCGICCEHYTLLLRLPKSLACSHTFCSCCLTEYIKKRKKSKTKFPCPVCRQETVLSKGGVMAMPNNYTIMHLIDLLNKRQRQNNETVSVRQSPGINANLNAELRQRTKTPCSLCDGGFVESNLDCGHGYCRRCYQVSVRGGLQCPMCDAEAGASTAEYGVPCLGKRRPPPYNPVFDEAEEAPAATAPNVPSATSNTLYDQFNGNYPDHKPIVPPRYSEVKRISPLKARSPNQPTTYSHAQPKPPPYPASAKPKVVKQRPSTVHLLQSPTSSNQENNEVSEMQIEVYDKELRSPVPPQRRSLSADQAHIIASPLKCLQKIGRYSETPMQTKTFQEPTRIDVCATTGDIVVVDSLRMTVQIFNAMGQYLSMFKVLLATGACFLSADKLAISTHRGVQIYQTNGERLRELDIGNVKNVVPYQFGFIVVKSQSLSIYRKSLTLQTEISRKKFGKLKRSTPFNCINDVTVNSNRDIIVLDSNEIFFIDEEGLVKNVIKLGKETCGLLSNPFSIRVDKNNNIVISDTDNERILRFLPTGAYSRAVINFALGGNRNNLKPYGLAIANGDHLLASICGDKVAEVRMYKLP